MTFVPYNLVFSSLPPSNRPQVEYAKTNRSTCKKSKQKIEKGEIRIGKMVENNYSDEVMKMPQWHKVGPFFEMMSKMRKSTKKPETIQDFGGYEALSEADQEMIKAKLQEYYERQVTITAAPPKKKRPKKKVEDEDEDEDEGQDDEEEDAKPEKKKAKATPKKPKSE